MDEIIIGKMTPENLPKELSRDRYDSKKWVLLLILIIVLIFAGYYFFALKNFKNTPTSTHQTADNDLPNISESSALDINIPNHSKNF